MMALTHRVFVVQSPTIGEVEMTLQRIALVLVLVLAVASCDDGGSSGLPDLTVDIVYMPEAGDDTLVWTLAWVVQNVGTVPSGETIISVDIYDSSWSWHNGFVVGGVPMLEPGEIHYGSTSMRIRVVDPVTGMFYVDVMVDPEDVVIESDEWNNFSTWAIRVW